MNTEKDNIRLIDMTVGDLLALLDKRDAERRMTTQGSAGLPDMVYGLSGIMQIYHCSKSTASRLLRSGKLDAAVSRLSTKTIAINVGKALSLCPNL